MYVGGKEGHEEIIYIIFKSRQIRCTGAAPYIQGDATAEQVINEASAWLCWTFCQGVGRDTNRRAGVELQGGNFKNWYHLSTCCLLSLGNSSLSEFLWVGTRGLEPLILEDALIKKKKNWSLKLFLDLKKILNFTVAHNSTISKHINPYVLWRGTMAKISEPGKLKERWKKLT